MDIEHLRNIQAVGEIPDLASTLRMVELNPTELCNRTCVFCPRSTDLYKNQKLFMDVDTAKKIAFDLRSFDFNGRLGFVGFGEPLLHKNLEKLIEEIRNGVPKLKWLEVNTNGDFLTLDRMASLKNSGCTHIGISMYDEDKSEFFKDMGNKVGINVIPRHHYDVKNNYGLKIVNRKDIINNNAEIKSINRPCYLPFYKVFIDWNGDVLLCDNDWSKKHKFGNIHQTNLKNIWINSELNVYRKQLIQNRRDLSPCNKCEINGMLFGRESFERFKQVIEDELAQEK